MRDYLYNLAKDSGRGFFALAVKPFLFLLSLLYGLLVELALFFAHSRPHRLDCKVISVGNITLGGTGKTTLVEYIAKYLKQQGRSVVILSRGYKRKITSSQFPATSYETMGDEPWMLKAHLDIPVLVDSNRWRSGQQAIRDFAADSVVLDDGFQQWRLFKDLEIVVIDARNPFGNQHLLPRGILREPILSLRRADVIVLTKTNLQPRVKQLRDYLQKINPTALIAEAVHQARGFCAVGKNELSLLPVEALRGENVTLFCGIGDPDTFRDLILSLGIKIAASFIFADHHPYSPQDMEKIIEAAQKKNINTLVTTEKDAVRIVNLRLTTGSLRLLALRIEARITQNEEGFCNRLLQLYNH